MTTVRSTIIATALAAGFVLTGCASLAETPNTSTPTAVTISTQPNTPPATTRPAPVPPTAATVPVHVASIGASQTVTASSTAGVKSTFVATIVSATWSDKGGKSYQSPPVNMYLVLDISIQGLTGSSQYNPYDWTVRGTDGREYQPSGGEPDPTLHNGYAEPGDLARGFIAFDLPQGAATVILGSKPGVRWAVKA